MAFGMMSISVILLVAGIATAFDRGRIDYEVVLALVTCISTGILGVILLIQYRADGRLLAWLLENEKKLEQEDCKFDDRKVTWNTEVRRFYFVFSMIFFTLKIPSRYYFSDDEPTFVINLSGSLYSLCFGLWGIPFGPIYTIQSIFRNSLGGEKATLRKVVDNYRIDLSKTRQ